MIRFSRHSLIASALTLFAAAGAMAQTNVDSTTQKVEGQVVVPERPTAIDANISPTTTVRPVRPERTPLPPEVLSRIEQFKKDARNYLEQQEALKKKLVGANEKERAIIRERLKELREQWLERSREIRKEFKERQQELADKLPGHREVLESLRSAAKEQARDAQQETRTRRGDD